MELESANPGGRASKYGQYASEIPVNATRVPSNMDMVGEMYLAFLNNMAQLCKALPLGRLLRIQHCDNRFD